jgi:hypothetical protein
MRRRVITARDVEAAAYAGDGELAYEAESSVVTPLARERANDLDVTLRPSGAKRPASRPGHGAESRILDELRPELAAEVLRRVQRRLEQP